jgi:NitT/TauT family transport system substrate-binding protein
MGRLTPFAKFMLTLLIVGGIFFGIKTFLSKTEAGQDLVKKSEQQVKTDDNKSGGGGIFGSGSNTPAPTASTTLKSSNNANTIKVGVVTWPGYVGGQYFNEGFKANEQSRFYKDYGFKVDFQILDDFEASRAAFKSGDVDLLWTTIDAFPTEAASLADFQPVIAFQSDWSRGGDAVVVRRGITKVADLKGKKIAVAEMTPSHSFLIWLLEAGGLKMSDVELVKQASAIDAAAAFKSQAVDAAVVWSPDDVLCVQSVPGSRILESTKSATNIISDVFIVKKQWAETNRTKLQQLYEGWMKGAAEINTSDTNRKKAAKILADAFNLPEGEQYQSISNVRLCTHGDNMNFFGLNPTYKGITAEQLYGRMGNTYKALGYVDKVVNYRIVSSPDAIRNTNLTSAEHVAEGQKVFTAATAADATKEAIATKRVSINFRSGEHQLDDNIKYIIDKEMVEIAKAFAGSRIRIEGNTDNVGNAAANKSLSEKRARAVVDYMSATHNMSRNRFIIVGNGSASPIAENASEEGRAKNRRTDFELVGQ